ncbi:mitochondrial carrier [Dendrothele bispora CBS 962.96]|uniref:Mitochondrial carrier n=1 Tax=Dendrothele bispora (strain CBS 962.96) TaxID=1314807 RepID=A0A4S8M0S2_DENBC|nr:mitochondrial carrier [Dendrothele bispora CBS 962.96]
MLGFFDILLLLASLGITLGIIVPLLGVLVRYRANYNPKGLQLDAEGGAQPHTGPIIHTYFGMMRRVYTIEGISGLYKGIMPTLLSTLLVALAVGLLVEPSPRVNKYRAPETGIFGTLLYSIGMMLLALPTSVITYRCITTPLKLSYFNAMKSLRVLLTPTERRKPWIIYLTPGLLAAEVLHIFIVVLGLNPIRRALLGKSDEDSDSDMSPAKLGIYLVFVCLSTVLLTPLEVIATRLAIQRNHASSEYNSVSQEVDGDAEDVTEFAGTEEDVIGLRNEEDPYVGLIDCAKRIIDEEGWSTLFRGWWWTFVGLLGTIP